MLQKKLTFDYIANQYPTLFMSKGCGKAPTQLRTFATTVAEASYSVIEKSMKY